MKSYFLMCVMMLLLFETKAQPIGKEIDAEAVKKWKMLLNVDGDRSGLPSNDGRYFVYRLGTEQNNALVLQGLRKTIVAEFPGAERPEFSDDNRYFFCKQADTLISVNIATRNIQRIVNIREFALCKTIKGQYLALLSTDSILIVRSLNGRMIYKMPGVHSFKVAGRNGSIAFLSKEGVILYDPINGGLKKISDDKNTTNLVLDEGGTHLAFCALTDNIWNLNCYSPEMSRTRRIGASVDQNAKLNFSADGNKLFFRSPGKENPVKLEKGKASVDVYSYTDETIMSRQLEHIGRQRKIKISGYNIHRDSVFTVSPDDFTIPFFFSGRKYILSVQNGIDDDEAYWRKVNKSISVISSENGERTLVAESDVRKLWAEEISPGEKYVTWFDKLEGIYYGYEIASRTLRQLTKGIPDLFDHEATYLDNKNAFGTAGWTEGDQYLIIYGRYDIWRVDPSCIEKPVNLTNNYGQQHRIIFRMMKTNNFDNQIDLKFGKVIAAFNTNNKQNGFWKMKYQKRQVMDPEILNMGNYVYYFPNISPDVLTAPSYHVPQKAGKTPIFIVRRMSAEKSPNLFATRDFKVFEQLTAIDAEKEYRWLTATLLKYRLKDGKESEGILYKPDGMTWGMKYPVIFNYYERRSDELNMYKLPELSQGILNVPWYVSRGYLVFIPNIYNTAKKSGEGITNSVLAAVEALSKLDYVDTAKMGLQGHSFGGYSTLSIVTRTNVFKAAQESAGVSDPVSNFGEETYVAPVSYYETRQGNFRATPWDEPNVYTENSPILNVNNLKTPLLMMHNKGDRAVPFSHAHAFFTGIRRSGKIGWLLQYDNESHGLYNDANRLDFTIRQQQFFDHYLKGKLAPVWMTKGINGSMKGIETGLEFDESEVIP